MLGMRREMMGGGNGRSPYFGKNILVFDVQDGDSDYEAKIGNITYKKSGGMTVDWGDGIVDSTTGSSITHAYESPGEYVVKLGSNALTFGCSESNNVREIYYEEGANIGSDPWYPGYKCPRLEKVVWISGCTTFPQYGLRETPNLIEIGPLTVFTDFSKPECITYAQIEEADVSNCIGNINSFFYKCDKLKRVVFGGGLKGMCGTFSGCTSLVDVNCRPTLINGAKTFAYTKIKHVDLTLLRNITSGSTDVFVNSQVENLYIPNIETIAYASLRNMPKVKCILIPKARGCNHSLGQLFTNNSIMEYCGPFAETGDFGIFGTRWWSDSCSSPIKTNPDGIQYRRVVEFRAMTCDEIISGSRFDQTYSHDIVGAVYKESGTMLVGSDGYLVCEDGSWVTRLYADGYTKVDYYALYLDEYKSKYPDEFDS